MINIPTSRRCRRGIR